MEELQEAEKEAIRHVQKSAFPGMFKALSTLSDEMQVKRVMKKEASSIFKLNPKLRGGLLSVGSQLENAPVDEDMKYSFVLPKDHHVTELIICHHHEKLVTLDKSLCCYLSQKDSGLQMALLRCVEF